MPEHGSPSAQSPDADGEVSSLRSAWQRFVDWLAGLNMWLVMGGGFALGLLANRIEPLEPFAFFFFLGAGLLPIVLQTVSTDDDGYDYEISNADRTRFVISTLRWSVTPWGVFTQIIQIVGNFVPYLRYRGALPNRERHVPDTDLRLPFDGEWTTVNGGVTEATSHSWGLVAQRYAYDFVVTDADGTTHEGNGEELTDYYAFGEPVRAPADGTVVKTLDRLRDYPNPGSGWTEWRTWQITGNYVVIEHDDGEYSLLAHLKEDSVTVESGDRVEAGDVVGECGNSGNTSEPHLHFQMQDRPNFWICAGLVPRFCDAVVDRDDDCRVDHDVYTDREVQYLWAGDRVRNETTADAPGSTDPAASVE